MCVQWGWNEPREDTLLRKERQHKNAFLLVCAADEQPDIKIPKILNCCHASHFKLPPLQCSCRHCNGVHSNPHPGDPTEGARKRRRVPGNKKKPRLGKDRAQTTICDDTIARGVFKDGLLGYIISVTGMKDYTKTK